MGTATTLSTPEDQVQALIRQVAEENQLEVSVSLIFVTVGALRYVFLHWDTKNMSH